jgi:hypothetical protein
MRTSQRGRGPWDEPLLRPDRIAEASPTDVLLKALKAKWSAAALKATLTGQARRSPVRGERLPPPPGKRSGGGGFKKTPPFGAEKFYGFLVPSPALKVRPAGIEHVCQIATAGGSRRQLALTQPATRLPPLTTRRHPFEQSTTPL